jgi:hypothetical protein
MQARLKLPELDSEPGEALELGVAAETGEGASVGGDVGDGTEVSTLVVAPSAGVKIGEGDASAVISGVGCTVLDGVGDSPSLGEADGEGDACVAVAVSVLVADWAVGVWDGSGLGVSGAGVVAVGVAEGWGGGSVGFGGGRVAGGREGVMVGIVI